MKKLLMITLISLIGCTAYIFDPPMSVNRMGTQCRNSSDCPFPSQCQADNFPSSNAICK
jgi:hypothetical protein